ncbi:hypothetical protein KCW65_22235, partial [Mycobacterium tuberculosis]|nr:hypothetical protein [Mycobacterium tuberculosis]
GILLIVLDRAAPTEDLQTLLEQSRDPDALPRRAVATTALSAIVAVVIAVVLAIIGIWWLSLQIPRKDAAKPLRLQQDARTGITSVTAAVVAEAVSDDLEATDGVEDSQVILRGTAK